MRIIDRMKKMMTKIEKERNVRKGGKERISKSVGKAERGKGDRRKADSERGEHHYNHNIVPKQILNK